MDRYEKTMYVLEGAVSVGSAYAAYALREHPLLALSAVGVVLYLLADMVSGRRVIKKVNKLIDPRF